MPEFHRTTATTRSIRTVCECGQGVAIECSPDDSLAFVLGLTDRPTESVARSALSIWEAAHECPPTVDYLMAALGLI